MSYEGPHDINTVDTYADVRERWHAQARERLGVEKTDAVCLVTTRVPPVAWLLSAMLLLFAARKHVAVATADEVVVFAFGRKRLGEILVRHPLRADTVDRAFMTLVLDGHRYGIWPGFGGEAGVIAAAASRR